MSRADDIKRGIEALARELGEIEKFGPDVFEDETVLVLEQARLDLLAECDRLRAQSWLNTLSYAATALEASADNGDRYAARQIRDYLAALPSGGEVQP